MAPTEPQRPPSDEAEDLPRTTDAGDDGDPHGHLHLHPLPAVVRVFLYFLGWLLLLIGILGLALPGIQGLLTIALGAALLSLASEAAHRRMRRVLRPWPRGQKLMDQFRAKLHRLLSRDPRP